MTGLNGTEFINNPFNTTMSPFTNLFQHAVGNGNVFYLFPLVILTFGVYMKTRDATMTSMFMLASGALLSSASIFVNALDMAVLFMVFAAIGIVGVFVSLLFQR